MFVSFTILGTNVLSRIFNVLPCPLITGFFKLVLFLEWEANVHWNTFFILRMIVCFDTDLCMHAID